MSKNQKIYILIGSIIGAILLIYNRPRIYCKDYYAVVNKANNKSYEAIINGNGPIKRKEIIGEFEYIYYEDGRIFVFYIFPSSVREFCRVEIASEEYRFGKRQLGVGTKRKRIELTYKHGKNKYYADDKHIEVIEANTSIGFYFNDENIVYKISVGEPDVYE